MMFRYKKILLLGLTALFGLVLSGCGSVAKNPLGGLSSSDGVFDSVTHTLTEVTDFAYTPRYEYPVESDFLPYAGSKEKMEEIIRGGGGDFWLPEDALEKEKKEYFSDEAWEKYFASNFKEDEYGRLAYTYTYKNEHPLKLDMNVIFDKRENKDEALIFTGKRWGIISESSGYFSENAKSGRVFVSARAESEYLDNPELFLLPYGESVTVTFYLDDSSGGDSIQQKSEMGHSLHVAHSKDDTLVDDNEGNCTDSISDPSVAAKVDRDIVWAVVNKDGLIQPYWYGDYYTTREEYNYLTGTGVIYTKEEFEKAKSSEYASIEDMKGVETYENLRDDEIELFEYVEYLYGQVSLDDFNKYVLADTYPAGFAPKIMYAHCAP